jgi:hypothetical protein
MKKLMIYVVLCLLANSASHASPEQDESRDSAILKTVLMAELEGNSVTLGRSNDLPFKEENFARTWSSGGLFNVSSKGQAFEIALEYIDRGWLQDAIWILDQTGHYKFAEQTLSDVIRLIRSPKAVGSIKTAVAGVPFLTELQNSNAGGAKIPPVEATLIDSPSDVRLYHVLYQIDRYFGLNVVPAMTLKHIPEVTYDDRGEHRTDRLFNIVLPVQNIGSLNLEQAKKLRNADRLAFLAEIFDLDLSEPELIGQKRTKGLFLSRMPQIKRSSFFARLIPRSQTLVPASQYTSELKMRILNGDLEDIRKILSPLGTDAEKVLRALVSIQKDLTTSQDKIAYRPYTTEQRLSLKNDNAISCEAFLSFRFGQNGP